MKIIIMEMKLGQKPLLVGAIVGPCFFLLANLCISGLMQAVWRVQPLDITRQLVSAMTWGALLGAITVNIYWHYKNHNFVRAKQLSLWFGASLSLLFLTGLLHRFRIVSSYVPLNMSGIALSNLSILLWFGLAFLESVALQWAFLLLFVGLWLPKREPVRM